MLSSLVAAASLQSAAARSSQDDGIQCTHSASGVTSSLSQITLKIILVEFSDVKHRTSPRAFTRKDFENLLLSSGVYVSPRLTSPDGDQVFGSVHDYFSIMSHDKLTVTGFLLNAIGAGDIPVWITLPHTKAYYQSFYIASTPLFADVDQAAAQVGIDVSRNATYGYFLIVIYAGNTYAAKGGLNPDVPISGDMYPMSELQGRPYGQENATDTFARIGIHCHEVGHLLGLGHSTSSRADVMDAGYANGPDNDGAAPAPLDPGSRMKLGWLTPQVVDGQETDTLRYSIASPTVYRINSATTNDFFLFELRQFDQYMAIGGSSVPDYNNAAFFPPSWPHGSLTQGVFAWRYMNGTNFGEYDHGLIYASGRLGRSYPENTPTATDDGVPFPGVAGVRVLSPWSDPRSPSGSTDGHNNIFVPSTNPTSNVGIEILNENPKDGYIVVKFYASRPEDAPPAKPQTPAPVLAHDRVQIAWSVNSEPDLARIPYRVYRKVDASDGGSLQPWRLIGVSDSAGYEDRETTMEGLYTYRIVAVDVQGLESVPSDEVGLMFMKTTGIREAESGQLAESTLLLQSYPNPFNISAVVSYQLSEVGDVKLVVYDILGREVKTLVHEVQYPGTYRVEFNAQGLASGAYVYRLTSGQNVESRRMLLMK